MFALKPSSEAVIAAREKVNELRARQRSHALQEEECANRIQYHIMRQSEIEDDIMAWEVHIDKLKREGK